MGLGKRLAHVSMVVAMVVMVVVMMVAMVVMALVVLVACLVLVKNAHLCTCGILEPERKARQGEQ
jgi:hypothetical protein